MSYKCNIRVSLSGGEGEGHFFENLGAEKGMMGVAEKVADFKGV